GVGRLTSGLARLLWWPLTDRLEGWWTRLRGWRTRRGWVRDSDAPPEPNLRWFLLRLRLQAWLRTRNYWHLIAGVPMLLACLAIGLLVFWGATIAPADLVARYRMRAGYASLVKNHRIARVCYERLADLGENQQDNHF